MRLPWRHQPARETNHTAPLPDGDVVPVEGYPRWSDLLRQADRQPQPQRREGNR